MKPDVFLKLMKKIRDNITHKDNDTNVVLSNRYSKRVNGLIKKVATELNILGIKSSHDLRRVYGNYSFRQYAPNNCSLQSWLASVLGHDSLGSAAANYSVIK